MIATKSMRDKMTYKTKTDAALTRPIYSMKDHSFDRIILI